MVSSASHIDMCLTPFLAPSTPFPSHRSSEVRPPHLELGGIGNSTSVRTTDHWIPRIGSVQVRCALTSKQGWVCQGIYILQAVGLDLNYPSKLKSRTAHSHSSLHTCFWETEDLKKDVFFFRTSLPSSFGCILAALMTLPSMTSPQGASKKILTLQYTVAEASPNETIDLPLFD